MQHQNVTLTEMVALLSKSHMVATPTHKFNLADLLNANLRMLTFSQGQC